MCLRKLFLPETERERKRGEQGEFQPAIFEVPLMMKNERLVLLVSKRYERYLAWYLGFQIYEYPPPTQVSLALCTLFAPCSIQCVNINFNSVLLHAPIHPMLPIQCVNINFNSLLLHAPLLLFFHTVREYKFQFSSAPSISSPLAFHTVHEYKFNSLSAEFQL
jgi:hypothetical protein